MEVRESMRGEKRYEKVGGKEEGEIRRRGREGGK